MNQPQLVTISRRRSQGSETFFVRVPREWAERQFKFGRHYVLVGERFDGSDELVVSPVTNAQADQFRLERRRERSREYQRRKYRERMR